jgi:hypothetical protein
MFFSNGNLRAGVCPLDGGAFTHNSNGSYFYKMVNNPPT